ncbi:hypothetical protein [Microbacterium sp. RU33B]|uniref:hypothetical protein n=1 Tax=Microbacterium sp. RU33B TaxID=1907390 RepID=UPI001180C73E|nr:hypothetical protein [Microbacterium sp. RU33B]
MSAGRRFNLTSRWLLLAVIVVAVAVILIIVGRVQGVPEPIESRADTEAARTADTYVLDKLNDLAEATDTAGVDRADAIAEYLEEATGQLVPGTKLVIMSGPRDGDQFGVAVFIEWKVEPFSVRDPGWGRACRIYTVGAASVTSEALVCPASVRDEPLGLVLSDDGWFSSRSVPTRLGITRSSGLLDPPWGLRGDQPCPGAPT